MRVGIGPTTPRGFLRTIEPLGGYLIVSAQVTLMSQAAKPSGHIACARLLSTFTPVEAGLANPELLLDQSDHADGADIER